MNIRKKLMTTAVASAVVGLTACGGDTTGTQDVGNTSGSDANSLSRVIYARAIDGYLAGATVYVDQNQNAQLDAFEPRALTDNDGYFSYNHITGIDYCASDRVTQHCLRGAISANEEVTIRVTGGYDTVTQLPFKGVLSLRSSELNRDDLRLVTPITSMVANGSMTAEQKFQTLVDAGILQQSGSFNDDPFNNAEQITRAQITAIISRLTGQVGSLSIGHSAFEDMESSAWASSYIAMASALTAGVGNGGSFGSVLSSPETLEAIMAKTIFSAVNPGQVMPANYTLPNPNAYQSLLQSTASLVALNEEILAALNGSASQEEIKAVLRLQMVAAERTFANPNDGELADLTAWVRAQVAQGNALGTDFTALGGENIDVGALIASSFDFDPGSNSISASAKIPAGAATAFASLVNNSFDVSIDKPDERGDAVLFLSGAVGARSGDITVCVRYRSDDDGFDTTSSTDPNGAMLVTGRWSLLNDHALTVSIDVAGGVRSLLLKAVGVNATGLDYRFDFGDDLTEWSGAAPAGFTAGAVPTSDATCKTALLEKFGQL
jgi:hypothetical protein